MAGLTQAGQYECRLLSLAWNRGLPSQTTTNNDEATMNSTSDTLTRSRWNIASVFAVVSDISGTLAQFMPMKSIFILAANELPSFFPRFLIELGTTITALVLIGVAAIFAVISAVTKKVADRLVERNASLPTKPERRKRNGTKPPLTFAEYESEILAVILLVGAAVVSQTFAGVVLAWLVAAGATLGIQIKRRPRRPPYHTAPLEFRDEFKKLVTKSSLWVTVGGALITLLIDFPASGVTGILLGAVLLQRFQKAVGELGLRLMRDKPLPTSHQRRDYASPPAMVSDVPLQAPLDFLATPTGKTLLGQSLRLLDMDPVRWQVVGQPNRNQASLSSERSIGGETFILRLFATDRLEFRDRELEFRRLDAHLLPTRSISATGHTIAGLPGIIIRLPHDIPPDRDRTVSGNDAIEWQCHWETRCLKTSDQRKMAKHQNILAKKKPIPDPNLFLLPHLNVLAQVNGPHQKAAKQTLRIFDLLRKRFLTGPTIYSIGGPISPLNLLPVKDGSLELLDLSNLELSLPGIAWSESPHFEKFITGNPETTQPLQSYALREALYRAKLKACGGQAASRNIKGFTERIEKILETVYGLENMKVPMH